MSIARKGAPLAACAIALMISTPAASASTAGTPVDPGGIDPALTQVNLLNINDFHGRIDDDSSGALGKAFACTVVDTRASLGAERTALLSAGDNIGASPFTSASQQDAPTIDVLNTLGLRASAVGNHEFDRGYSDLTGRVADRADFALLGANVYDKGTTNPALPEYELIQVGDLNVGVIGAVTKDTASLVSPQGITDIEFGDPVAAVNRVAGDLSDGSTANGEADIIVAEYHEGATEGADLTTLEEQVAAGGSFASIVTDTSAEVDAIFTGHTHKEYAWDAPAPGGGTRPIIQSNSYGDKLGQVQLGFDEETGEVTQYSATNIPLAESTDACTGDSTYTAAARLIDDAVADANEIGKEVVGTVADDITTAYNDGNRDDRQRESTLGNLSANIWRDALNDPGRSGADIGVMNPGSLRAELLYEPSAQEAPGEVTYAEAASINPFANTLMTVDVTGEQFVTLLEQQWQPEGSSRPFLKLGLSDNVTYTYDPDAAKGGRITSVTVDGEPLDESSTYTVASSSFLILGGDNFTVLAEGANAKDTGLIDTDAFVDHLKAAGEVSPSYRKQAVAISEQPSRLVAGEEVSFTASGFDLTSLGSPTNADVEVFVGDDSVGTFPITAGLIGGTPTRNGSADISFTVPKRGVDVGASRESAIRLVAGPSGTEASFPVTVTDDSVPEPTEPEPTDSSTSAPSPSASQSSTSAPDDQPTGPVVETDRPGAGPSGAQLGWWSLAILGLVGAAVADARRRAAIRRH